MFLSQDRWHLLLLILQLLKVVQAANKHTSSPNFRIAEKLLIVLREVRNFGHAKLLSNLVEEYTHQKVDLVEPDVCVGAVASCSVCERVHGALRHGRPSTSRIVSICAYTECPCARCFLLEQVGDCGVECNCHRLALNSFDWLTHSQKFGQTLMLMDFCASA